MTNNLYRLSPNSCFIKTLADFILKNFGDDCASLRVILPNSLACLRLKDILIERQNIALLPNILPFSNIMAEGESIFEMSSSEVNVVTNLEEKVILAEIISEYKKLSFNITQALSFTPKLSALFHELVLSDISIADIRNVSKIDQAIHWQNIHEFLEYAYSRWQSKIAYLHKTDIANYSIKTMRAEIGNLDNKNSKLIIAGIFGANKAIWNFLHQASIKQNAFIILPPIAHFDDLQMDSQAHAREKPLYCLQRLLTTLDKKLSDFTLLGINNNSTLDRLLIAQSSLPCTKKEFDNKIEYFEYENIFDEAEALSKLCLSEQHNGKKIAIIVNSEKTKDIYLKFLLKRSIEFNDLTFCSIKRTHEVHLIVSIADFILNEFNLTNLILLLKNPLIYCEEVVKLEKLLAGKNRFVSNWRQLDELILKAADPLFITWYQNIQCCLPHTLNTKTFANILKSLLKIVENLCPTIWTNSISSAIYDCFTEIILLNWSIIIEKPSDFVEILKLLLSGSKFSNKNHSDANLVLIDLNSAYLLKFDLAILTNCNEGAIPITAQANPWFNRQVQDEVGLHSSQICWGSSLYKFYLLLHNGKVIITRAKKHDGKNTLIPSTYLQKLQYILEMSPIESHPPSLDNQGVSKNKIAHSDFFPNRLSATDIELLIRSPYSFYAKNILKLRKQESITKPPTIAEFGSFMHKLFDLYNKNYADRANNTNLLEYLSKLSDEILKQLLLPDVTKKIWSLKFSAIAEEFIEFDSEYRSKASHIYSEASGEIDLVIADHSIKLVAVADRVQINKDGSVMIMDYKTGAIPSGKEINSGLSPQLIVIALIAMNDGFGFKLSTAPTLIYVKIASSSPYIKTTKINLNKDELEEHFIGLKNLLAHYIRCKTFSTEYDLLKYNDYRLLMRAV